MCSLQGCTGAELLGHGAGQGKGESLRGGAREKFTGGAGRVGAKKCVNQLIGSFLVIAFRISMD